MDQSHQCQQPLADRTGQAAGGTTSGAAPTDQWGQGVVGRGQGSPTVNGWVRPVPPRGSARVHAGQALTETALLIGLFLLPLYGILVTHRLVDAHLQAATVAREAARVMAEAPSAEVALAAGRTRTLAVVIDLGLRPERLTVTLDPGAFDRAGTVSATVRYRVDLRGIPLFGLPDPVISNQVRQPVQMHASR